MAELGFTVNDDLSFGQEAIAVKTKEVEPD